MMRLRLVTWPAAQYQVVVVVRPAARERDEVIQGRCLHREITAAVHALRTLSELFGFDGSLLAGAKH